MDRKDREIAGRERRIANGQEWISASCADLFSLLSTLSARFPLLDSQLLIAHVLGRPRSWVMAHPEAKLAPEEHSALASAAARLEEGEPLPYILGQWEFYGLEFFVTPAVLIPRPETELLVETALAGGPWQSSGEQRPQVLDVGTGSGCIAVSFAAHCPSARLLATDISAEALSVARRNAERHAVAERIQFVQADLLPVHLPSLPFDLLLANLPYIPSATLHGLDVYGKEPTGALDGGADGLEVIGRLLEKAPALLGPRGLALLEIEASQGEAAARLARQHFPHASIRVSADLASHDRMLSIQT